MDRLEIVSPGSAPRGLTITKIKEGRSKIRNSGIASVFNYWQLIEKWGTGIPRVIEECINCGLKEPVFVDDGDFRVILYREKVNQTNQTTTNVFPVNCEDSKLSGRRLAYNAINSACIMTYWNIGKRIVDDEQGGEERAKYGHKLIKALAESLTSEFGKGFSERNLNYYRQFYLYFPDFEIVNARVHNLSWTHIRALLRISDEDARLWYLNEASKENWSSRTLDRNIATQYYYRLLQAPKKEIVMAEMKEKTKT